MSTAPVAYPNITYALTASSDGTVAAITAAARSNPYLAMALLALEGWKQNELRIERMRDLAKDLLSQAPTAAARPADLVMDVLDGESSTDLPTRIMEDRAKFDALFAAHQAAYDVAASLVSRRTAMIRARPNTILTSLDKQLIEIANKAQKRAKDLSGVRTAEDAIARGVTDQWSAAKDDAAAVEQIRAAQQMIVRLLHGDLFETINRDGTYEAVVEIGDWREVDPRLPQTLRHGGLWVKDNHRGRLAEKAETWTVAWPHDRVARTVWLMENHPDQMRVPTMDQMESAHSDLIKAMAQTTPTGGTLETSLTHDEAINDRRAGAR